MIALYLSYLIGFVFIGSFVMYSSYLANEQKRVAQFRQRSVAQFRQRSMERRRRPIAAQRRRFVPLRVVKLLTPYTAALTRRALP